MTERTEETMDASSLNRRTFLKASAGVAAACAAPAAMAFAEEAVTGEDVTCDLVVVGAGIGGLSCAIEAADLGLDVVLLEKEANLGGTLPGTEGIFGLASGLQTERGLEMPEPWQLVQKELEYANYRTDPLLWDDVFAAAGEDVDWLGGMGVTFENVDRYLGQSDYDTFHWWEGETGAGAGAALGEVAQEKACVMMETPAIDLIVENGKVCGVVAQAADGSTISVHANAVVLAAGGMANDLELLSEKTGMDLSESMSLFPIHCTGDALRMAQAAGAQETPVSVMNVFGVRGHGPNDAIVVAGTLQPTSLIVNEEAERFMAEDLYIKKFFALVTNAWKAQGRVFNVFSAAQVQSWENEGCICGVAAVKAGDRLEGLVAQLEEDAADGTKGVWSGETLAELAEAMGVDPDALAATVDRYNQRCAEGHDADFGKDEQYLEPLENGPFYAVNPVYSVFATMGGILVDRQMRVLDDAGKPIEGLLSAGSASCGLYKETYCYQVSGGMNAYCCYSGRTAARTAAAAKA